MALLLLFLLLCLLVSILNVNQTNNFNYNIFPVQRSSQAVNEEANQDTSIQNSGKTFPWGFGWGLIIGFFVIHNYHLSLPDRDGVEVGYFPGDRDQAEDGPNAFQGPVVHHLE